MLEYLFISFSPHLTNFDNYFKEYDEEKYNGELEKGITKGDYLWLGDSRILISKIRLEVYNNWFESFNQLVNWRGLIIGNRPEELDKLFKSGNHFYIFNNLKKLDEKNEYGFDSLTHFFNKVLEQPIYYLNVIKETEGIENEDLRKYKRYELLSRKIDLQRDKFFERRVELRNKILDNFRSDPERIKATLRELILSTEQILINTQDFSNEYSFEYKKSPLFNVYMDFIRDVQIYLEFLGTGGRLPLIENFFKTESTYSKPFDTSFLAPRIQVTHNNKVEESKRTFISLFKDKGIANEVKAIFETNGFTKENKWIGVSGNKTELLAAFYVLNSILNAGKVTPKAKVFYNEFGLKVGKNNLKNGEYITERSFRTEPFNQDREEFERLFSDILKQNR